MTTTGSFGHRESKTEIQIRSPDLNIRKLGIVSRDYRHTFPNGCRDFSHVMPSVLKRLDDESCDAVLFSLYSIALPQRFDLFGVLRGLKRISAVFIEEFRDEGGSKRTTIRYVVYYRSKEKWTEYDFQQKFGTLTGMPPNFMSNFVANEVPKRILGNCCVLLCGESNGVKYSRANKNVEDRFGLRAAIPQQVSVILNPIHDRMTRFEMKRKRKFLSECKRWVVSVWNRGKEDKNGKARDGSGLSWTIFYDGCEKLVEPIPNEFEVDIGVLDMVK